MAKEQQRQIGALKEQIQRNKTQRVTLTRKLKEAALEHQRWKSDKAKELLRAKRAAGKKDREIQQLRA